ncbi:MAG: MurR/RpiR family transcriptional regulator [Lachnospiraceae bacterium]|nr:MurR/RpiR family transcriptional regulator [Lachnospiraceae bacterium]
MNMILKIQSVYNQFTKAEKKVADYCLQHREEVPFLSITDLADACGVGDTSVYRFCRTLKLEGYQEFKMKFSLAQGTASMEAQLMRGGALGQAGAGDAAQDAAAPTELARRVLETHQNAIAETYMMLDREELEKVLIMFDNAKRVYFFGIGDSLLVAQEAMSKFLRITGKVNCIQDPHMQAVAAAMMNEEDLVFIISYSGATKDNLQVAKIAKDSGAKVAAISHFMKSPLTAYCDAVLLCGAKEGPLDGGSMSAKLGQLYLIDLLYQGFYERNMQECVENNQKASAAVMEKLL